ncbi:MAG TPA: hypothetical protein VJ579_05095 [Candidatus Paceibacterota bacterium]|nr:hypothetical protein [Candidatus Paceibacterota bacterium]
MGAARLHTHPKSGKSIYGELIQPGTKLTESDVHPAENGNWERCEWPGLKLCSGCEVIWVRPVVHTLPDGSAPSPTHHAHPASLAYVYGTLIKPCTVLLATDVYSSSDGKWEPCPCPGVVLECLSDNVVWVRPAEEPK